jgi:hypothetical protein
MAYKQEKCLYHSSEAAKARVKMQADAMSVKGCLALSSQGKVPIPASFMRALITPSHTPRGLPLNTIALVLRLRYLNLVTQTFRLRQQHSSQSQGAAQVTLGADGRWSRGSFYPIQGCCGVCPLVSSSLDIALHDDTLCSICADGIFLLQNPARNLTPGSGKVSEGARPGMPGEGGVGAVGYLMWEAVDHGSSL